MSDAAPGLPALHLLIEGRVQGVGYRDWLVATAQARGLHGWVRNLHDGRVEAVLAGAEAALREALAACRAGPDMAHVTHIGATPCPPPSAPGFTRRPSAGTTAF